MKGRLLWGCSAEIQFICGSNNGSVVSTSLKKWICDSPGLSTLTIQNAADKKEDEEYLCRSKTTKHGIREKL